MGLELGLWRAEAGKLVKVEPSGVPLESELEELLEFDPSVLGTKLLILGRQVFTSFGGYIDLLGLDADGTVHVLELKRDKTPRDVVAQVLDYASWVSTLSHQDVTSI